MDTLTSLRYARYMTMMAKSNKVVPQRLPPTEHIIIACVCIFKSSGGLF